MDDESGAWGNIGIDYIVFSDRPAGAAVKPQEQPDFGTMALAVLFTGPGDAVRVRAALPDGPLPARVFPADDAEPGAGAGAEPGAAAESRPFGRKLTGSISWRILLDPGDERVITFVVAWHFPRLKLDRLTTDGRWYAKRFGSAVEVVEYVAKHFDRLADTTGLWRDTWYDSTLPYWFLDRTFANTSILATATCYRFATGRFYGWEGVGCCPGTCTHVWHYAQAMGRLFPELERGRGSWSITRTASASTPSRRDRLPRRVPTTAGPPTDRPARSSVPTASTRCRPTTPS